MKSRKINFKLNLVGIRIATKSIFGISTKESKQFTIVWSAFIIFGDYHKRIYATTIFHESVYCVSGEVYSSCYNCTKRMKVYTYRRIFWLFAVAITPIHSLIVHASAEIVAVTSARTKLIKAFAWTEVPSFLPKTVATAWTTSNVIDVRQRR